MARHTSKLYSVSGQVLARISLVRHFAALKIVPSKSLNFPLSHDRKSLYKHPEKKIQRSNLENKGTGKMAPINLPKHQQTTSDGRCEVVPHLTGKLYPQENNPKQCPSS
jgi:hypothetical protein